MWTRSKLKGKAKASLKANYWKTVLVALLVIAVVGGGGAGAGAVTVPGVASQESAGDADGFRDTYSTTEGDLYDEADADSTDDSTAMNEVSADDGAAATHQDADAETLFEAVSEHDGRSPLMLMLFVLIVFVLIIVVAIIALQILVFYPLEVGAARFFTRNLNQRAEVKEVAYAFDHGYVESVKALFFRDLFTLLWSLLLIIPGIVKSYEYRMIPYLLADDPAMTCERAFAESKRMMDGNKWGAFVLDLSFIGWHLLSALTLGILDVFYVSPYVHMTAAALYEELRYGDVQSALPQIEAPAGPIV